MQEKSTKVSVPGHVTLIAVSKQQPESRVRAALGAGQRVFGENRVREARERWAHRREGVELHLIGPLQTNKVKQALDLFDVIHTLDRPKLVRAVKAALSGHSHPSERGGQGGGPSARTGDDPPRTPPLQGGEARERPAQEGGEAGPRARQFFVQVNTGEEGQKAGCLPRDLPGLLKECEGLPVTGLMCIPPLGDPPELHFALLKTLAEAHGLPHLSMGMSADYEAAIALGATHVRVGSALFGPRGR